MESVRKKRGRPKKENSKKKMLMVRLNDEDMGIVLANTFETGETYSDFVRKAVRFYDAIMRKDD